MKILIYTTHRTGSTSLANFLMFNYSYDYQRHSYFTKMKSNLPNDIIIKLTPNEEKYNDIKSLFDKRIVLIREDINAQSESRVYSEVFGKKFSSYSISNDFLYEYKSEIKKMSEVIVNENKMLSKLSDCLVITYDQLYKSNEGVTIIESYLDTKFQFGLEYKQYRNMNQNLV